MNCALKLPYHQLCNSSSTFSTQSGGSLSSTSSSESAGAKAAPQNSSSNLPRQQQLSGGGGTTDSSGGKGVIHGTTGVSASATKRKSVFPPFNNAPSSPAPQVPAKLDAGPACQPRDPRHQTGRIRSRALYDCDADNEDELNFKEGEVIVVLSKETEDDGWWEGEIEGDPQRHGIFPFTFVQIIE